MYNYKKIFFFFLILFLRGLALSFHTGCLFLLGCFLGCCTLCGKLLVSRVVLADSPACDLHTVSVSTRLNNERIVLNGNDLADDAADRCDFVADLKVVTHCLLFLLLFLLRSDHKKIHNGENSYHHENHCPAAAFSGCLSC